MNMQDEVKILELEKRVTKWADHAMFWRDAYRELARRVHERDGVMEHIQEHLEITTDLPSAEEYHAILDRMTKALSYVLEQFPAELPPAENILSEAMPLLEGESA